MTTPASDILTGRQDRIQREKAILDQLPLVHYIARCIHKRPPRHVLLEDLVHAGVIGLIDALGKFDPRKHVQLSSYAKYRIRGAILDSLRGGDWGPRDLRRKARELEKSNHKLRSELGRNPSDSESAAELGLDLHSFHVLQRKIDGLEVLSMQGANVMRNGEEVDLLAQLPDRTDKTPFRLFLGLEMRQLVTQALARLTEKERRLLILYYFEGVTMKQIGAALGVCESRVSQLHSRAIASLRGVLAALSEGAVLARDGIAIEIAPLFETSAFSRPHTAKCAPATRVAPDHSAAGRGPGV